ncbi:LysR family transcriptional regulator [Mycolicibacterium aromaticivorans JS19b1 = JCM 16368]|uniref:Probable hydrogen peroxide-inducible genes activator n=1 Tax=Mycolicibacterium aromaticivorans JS19b1 = JCM 16368 TaxID=1440774 RepID=A0A064CI79_9MYCO|nr:LysR family transcriptional regulator [Mycolicibacterium aromaticivorans]KDE98492.1 LysR family transcriptional regulator [Mycolicibacterium aromaticivorans JS19b1 = JCM 16368]
MHLEELQWFVVLAETEHVTEAAAELGVSQPTLSRALSRLEQNVGVPLFDRVGRRLHLNEYGRIMLEHCRRSLAEVQAALDRIATLRDPDTGRVRLAFLHSLANWYVPEQLRRFRETAPKIQFDLFQGAAHEIARSILDGGSDVAVTSPRPDPGAFSWHRLYVERLCLAVSVGHRLAGRSRVSLSAAASEPFVALEKPFGLRQLTDELWVEAGIDPQIVFEASEIPTMEGLVAAGFGVAVVPVPRDGTDARVIHVPLSNSRAKREVGLAWARSRPLAPPSRRFVDFLAGS